MCTTLKVVGIDKKCFVLFLTFFLSLSLSLFVCVYVCACVCVCGGGGGWVWGGCLCVRVGVCLSVSVLGNCSVTKTCLYNFDPLKPHFYIVKLVYIIFLISAQNHRLWVQYETYQEKISAF